MTDFEKVLNCLTAVRKTAKIKISRNFTDFFTDRIRQAASKPDLVTFMQRLIETVNGSIGYVKKDTFSEFMKAAKGKKTDSILYWLRHNSAVASMLCTIDEDERAELLPEIEIDLDKDTGVAYPCGDFDINLDLTCLTQLSHGDDFKSGNATLFRRMAAITDKNQVVELPYYAGNAFRGQMRDCLGDNMLEALGIPLNRARPVIALWFFHVLYSGGSLSESGKEELAIIKELGNQSFKTDGINEVRNLLPHLSLLGFAVGNKIISGRCYFNDLRPVCKEWGFESDLSVDKLMDWHFFTRREDYEGGEDVKNESMIVNTECLVPGTKLFGGINISKHTSEVEKSALFKGLELMKKAGAIGASNRQGYGKVDIKIKPNIEFEADLYDNFLKENRDRINDFLKSVKGVTQMDFVDEVGGESGGLKY